MSETERIYNELEDAALLVRGLGMVNHFSLDTAEKKLEWDVLYKKAQERLSKAFWAKENLVNKESNKGRA